VFHLHNKGKIKTLEPKWTFSFIMESDLRSTFQRSRGIILKRLAPFPPGTPCLDLGHDPHRESKTTLYTHRPKVYLHTVCPPVHVSSQQVVVDHFSSCTFTNVHSFSYTPQVGPHYSRSEHRLSQILGNISLFYHTRVFLKTLLFLIVILLLLHLFTLILRLQFYPGAFYSGTMALMASRSLLALEFLSVP